MPTTYAHWRFGNECIKTLPEDLQKIVNENRDVFDFGVHGPDIFFYYNCLKSNDVNKYGSRMHEIPFRETLAKLKPNYQKHDNKEAALAYLLGFLCHFTLDSYCHGYIDRKAEVSTITHGTIESQLDRYFLTKDGYNPVKKSVTFSLKPSKQAGHVIGQLFEEQGDEVCFKTISDQKKYLDLLKDNSNFKRWFLETAMDLFKISSWKDLLLTNHENPECIVTNMRLDKLFEKGKEHYPKLALSLVAYLNNDQELDVYFKNHFCPKDDYQSIPILSIKEEESYEVELQD